MSNGNIDPEGESTVPEMTNVSKSPVTSTNATDISTSASTSRNFFSPTSSLHPVTQLSAKSVAKSGTSPVKKLSTNPISRLGPAKVSGLSKKAKPTASGGLKQGSLLSMFAHAPKKADLGPKAGLAK